jgi:hypothetical protein
MALNDIKVPKENAQGTFDEIALAASDLKLGTTANLPLKTGTNGVIEAGSFGTAAGSFCEGNDARLSDDRDPNLHAASHAAGGSDPVFDQDLNTTDSVEFASLTVADLFTGAFEALGSGSNFTRVLGDGGLEFGGTNAASALTNLGAAASGSITSSGLTQATARILGRTTASTGAVEEIQIGSGLSLSAGELSATGGDTVSIEASAADILSVASGAISADDAGADRIVYWNNTSNKLAYGTPADAGAAASSHTHSDATQSVAGFLSTADKTKLDGIASGAEVNVNADWNASSGDAQILNKPTLGTAAAAATTDFATAAQGTKADSAVQPTIVDTKGDLLVGSAADTVARLPVGGTNGHALVVDSAETLGMKWAAVSGVVSGSVDNAVLRADGTGGSTSQGSAFIIADNATASPNNTVNHASIQATGGTTNVSVSIVPKGSGAFMLDVPDAGTGGGNARGANAVDLQTVRNNANQVASGVNSFIGAGRNNRAAPTDSVVCGGQSNAIATGEGSFIGAGWGNSTGGSAEWVGIVGGLFNTADGAYSFVGGGRSNQATGSTAVVVGGGTASAIGNFATGAASGVLGGMGALADRHGIQAHAAGAFNSTAGSGDAQRIRAVLRCTTSNATATELFLNGSSIRLTIPTNKIMAGIINIVGTKTDGAAVAHYVRQFCVKNVSGTSSAVYTAQTIGTDNAAGTSITFNDPDTNGDALSVSVTGIASENWRWVASVDAVEITRT